MRGRHILDLRRLVRASVQPPRRARSRSIGVIVLLLGVVFILTPSDFDLHGRTGWLGWPRPAILLWESSARIPSMEIGLERGESGPTSVVLAWGGIGRVFVFVPTNAGIDGCVVLIAALLARGIEARLGERLYCRLRGAACYSCGYPLTGLPTNTCPECGVESRLTRKNNAG